MAKKTPSVSVEEFRQKERIALIDYDESGGDPPLAMRFFVAQEERIRAEEEENKPHKP